MSPKIRGIVVTPNEAIAIAKGLRTCLLRSPDRKTPYNVGDILYVKEKYCCQLPRPRL